MPRGLKRHAITFALRTSVPAFGEINRIGYQLVHVDYDRPMDEVIDLINDRGLNILAGSPTFLMSLAQHAPKITAPVDVVVSYAEILEDHVAVELARAFGAPVYQLYAATEGYVAASCALGNLHINEDLLRVKLDPVPKRRRVPSMRVTDLFRISQPTVNYALNDLIELDPEPCRRGSRFQRVARIIGRSDDYFTGVGPEGGEGIVEYQVVQRVDGSVHATIQLSPDVAASPEPVSAALTALFERHWSVVPNVTTEVADHLEFPTDLKRKRVAREG